MDKDRKLLPLLITVGDKIISWKAGKEEMEYISLVDHNKKKQDL